MKKTFITLSLLAVVAALSGCTDYMYQLVCKRDGNVVYDSGLVDFVYRSDRSDTWDVGWGSSYQPEPGSTCQAFRSEVSQ